MAATAAKMGKQNPKMSAAEKADVRQATKDRKAKKALQKAAKADIRRTASSKAARLSKSALAELGASPSKVKDKESRVKGHCLFAEVMNRCRLSRITVIWVRPPVTTRSCSKS